MPATAIILLGVAACGNRTEPAEREPLSAREREAAATELLSGIRISATALGSSLAASKALVDYLPENDVRLVLVRIVDQIDLQIRIEAERTVTFREPPSFCLIGPYSAPDDAGYTSPCWGTPDVAASVGPQLVSDDAGHVVFPAGQPIVLLVSVGRGGDRCDYPPGEWLLDVDADPWVDGVGVGTRQLAEVGFEIPWRAGGPLAFLPVRTVAYCGSANVVYHEQGEPQIASPSP